HFVVHLLGLHCAADGKLQELQLSTTGRAACARVKYILLPTRDIRLEKASHTSKQLGSNKRGAPLLQDEERFSGSSGPRVRTAAVPSRPLGSFRACLGDVSAQVGRQSK